MRRRPAVLAVAPVLVLVSAVASAYWTGSSTPGGGGAAAATSVNQGAAPSVSAVAGTVTVSWAASTLASGQAVSGYTVTRYDADALVAQTILSACTGRLLTTSCVESGVPSGSWKYAVTPVFATNWAGPESAKSATVTIDVTPPENAIGLASVVGDAYLGGSTVYYRGAVGGSLRLTNAVSDTGSGPAGSTTNALTGTTTGWAHTPSTVATPAGGPYLSNPFSWSAGTTSAPGEAVTGRDVVGNTATTNLTFVNDSTAPTAGTITYADGFTSSRSATIGFTTGTDAGSGIATRRLQRAGATLGGGGCGVFGSFLDIGTDGPTSPYVDGSLPVGCFRYRYVVTDRLGNQDVATSANIVKVSYADAVAATTGLLSQWRLGDDGSGGQIASDTFTGSAGSLLAGGWVRQAGTANATLSDLGRIYRAGAGGHTVNTASLTPVNADYSVEADVVRRSSLTGDMAGVVGRLTSSGTYYLARWEQATTSWNLVKYSGGVLTRLDSDPASALTANVAYRLELEMVGTTLNLYVDGVLRASAADGTITAPGKAGVVQGDRESGSNAAQSNTTGLHLDNFSVTSTYRALDSKGTNHGGYVNGTTRGVAGAMPASSDTAASFDGVDDYVQMTGTTGIPVGAASRSVEAWFKTSSAARQVLFHYGSLASTQEFGLWIEAGGATMNAWGYGVGNDKVFTMPSAVNDGAWHQVVLTYNGTTLTLYIDGVALPTQAATRATVMDAYGFAIGAVVTPGDASSGGYFNGSIDEVSFYTSVLSASVVTDHYQLGTAAAVDGSGPSGGSIDATGLVGSGSRYSTSANLSLALAMGADPSGLATGGNQVLRAAASLTGGTCGSYGGYTVVATDPSTPLSDTVADQACYRYRYVVSDALGNATTYTSPDIKVDGTAPSAPTLAFSAFANTWWPGSGSTVYYRSTATSGSVTATATASDAASGIASYSFPALGASWTSTPGSLGVNTYSWTGTPAAPGIKNATATNNAALASAGAPFTLTADDTPPSSGTVTYADTTQTSTSVSVGFTTGSDAASGLGTRLLQRAAATLSGTTCGSYGAFATLPAGTNPTSPFSDTVTAGSCYKYQYVVSDQVGNTATATSANVVKVSVNYFATVSATPGLVNYFRLGEAITSADSMTGTAGATLQSRSGETAASWTKHPAATADAVLTPAGRVRKSGTSSVTALGYTSATPASADYTVEGDLYVASHVAGDAAGLVGRLVTSSGTGSYYLMRYEQTGQMWSLFRVVDNSWAWLGGASQTLSPGSTYRMALDMRGTTIRMLVDGVQVASVTDSGISAAGRAGILLGAAGSTTLTDTTGYHVDNFRVSPPAADAKGTNHGTYLGGVGLGTTGAINGDANTAATFDGANDQTAVARQVSDDFSIELWFKSTQGIGTGSQWSSGAGLVDGSVTGAADDFGVSLRSDGKVVAGIGTPDVSVVSTTGGYNNGAWHHVVFTRTRATGALALYVDGVAAGTATGASTASLTASPGLSFGRLQSGANYLVGSLDEIAIYGSVLSAATVSAHYGAG